VPVHLKSIPSLSLAFPPFLSPPLSRDLSRAQMLDANAITPQLEPQPSTPVTTNGLHCDHPTTDADSPIADSPDTPVNTVSDVAVKITSDVPEVESDVRHEPFQFSLSKLDDASIGPQIDTPIDPSASFFQFFSLSSPYLSFSPQTQYKLNSLAVRIDPHIYCRSGLFNSAIKTLN
jgi:hypothetical protein